MDCSPPGSSVHGILQARILEWVAITFSKGSAQPGGLNPGLLNCRQSLYCLSYREDPYLFLSSVQFSSVAQSCPTLCSPSESQHARLPCPSPTPGLHSD